MLNVSLGPRAGNVLLWKEQSPENLGYGTLVPSL